MRAALTLALLAPFAGWSEPIEPAYVEQVANAIYKAEGGSKTWHPYGIIAGRRLTEPEARRWCVNTIKNNWTRWQKAGSPGDYLEFLAQKYCPVGAANDPTGLNKNWLRNVRALLKKEPR